MSATLLLAGAGAAGAVAAPASGASGPAPSMIEQIQFFWNGQEYCFYDDGWRGPGWYICGYAWRQGLGWGGGRSWYERNYRDHDRRDHREGPREYRDRDHRDRDMDHRRDTDHDMRGGGDRRGGDMMRGGEQRGGDMMRGGEMRGGEGGGR